LLFDWKILWSNVSKLQSSFQLQSVTVMHITRMEFTYGNLKEVSVGAV